MGLQRAGGAPAEEAQHDAHGALRRLDGAAAALEVGDVDLGPILERRRVGGARGLETGRLAPENPPPLGFRVPRFGLRGEPAR